MSNCAPVRKTGGSKEIDKAAATIHASKFGKRLKSREVAKSSAYVWEPPKEFKVAVAVLCPPLSLRLVGQ